MAKKISSGRNTVGFSARTFSANKEILKQEILQATEGSSEMRHEISRVFQRANRRIQNIEKADLFSPAVEALNKGDITGYSKFRMGGASWVELKMEYAKAVAFLRQPTSTAGGSREYNNHIRDAYDLTDDEYKLMMDNFRGKLMSVSDSDFVERYLMRYKDFTGELETAAEDVSGQIETEAVSVENALQKDIENAVDNLVGGLPDLDEGITIS